MQPRSLKNLTETRVKCHPSVIVSFSSEESLRHLRKQLKQIPDPAEQVEIKELILYRHVVKRIKKFRLRYASGYEPSKVPKDQV